LYCEYFTKKALEGFGGLKTGQIIHTTKCADDLLKLAKDETALQGMYLESFEMWCWRRSVGLIM
jgi:hypothetical protein